MTLDYVTFSISLCPEVGDDEFIILCILVAVGWAVSKLQRGELRALPPGHRKQKRNSK